MKFNEFKFYISVFFVCVVLLAACSGEDGDPGPQGDQGLKGDQGNQGIAGNNGYQKLGSLQGTVVGTRKDGTAFSEPFKYEYTGDSVHGFTSPNGVKNINVSRYLNSFADSYMHLGLKSEDEILTPSSATYSCYFNFIKQLDSETMFKISATPYFLATEAFVRELAFEKNQLYRFSTTGSYSEIYYNESNYKGLEDAYQFTVYGNVNMHVYYSMVDGSLLGLYKWSDGLYYEDGELFNLYNKIEFLNNTEHDRMVFYDAVTNDDLFESVPAVPADALTITNYVHDAATGVLSFNFVLTISGYISNNSRENSTFHDLTVTGSYNSGGKVYKNIVGRQGS
jgi:hypothetical protein